MIQTIHLFEGDYGGMTALAEEGQMQLTCGVIGTISELNKEELVEVKQAIYLRISEKVFRFERYENIKTFLPS